MAVKKKNRCVDAFFGSKTCIRGTLEFQGKIQLDGEVIGKIRSDEGTLIIGESAVVKANIFVRVALISGEVVGTIRAFDRIELSPSARISGDLAAKIIRIDKGAVIKGNCVISDSGNININSNISENYSVAKP